MDFSLKRPHSQNKTLPRNNSSYLLIYCKKKDRNKQAMNTGDLKDLEMSGDLLRKNKHRRHAEIIRF